MPSSLPSDPSHLPMDQIAISDSELTDTPVATTLGDAQDTPSIINEHEDVVMTDHTGESGNTTAFPISTPTSSSDKTPSLASIDPSTVGPMRLMSAVNSATSSPIPKMNTLTIMDPYRFSILRYASSNNDPTENLHNMIHSKSEQLKEWTRNYQNSFVFLHGCHTEDPNFPRFEQQVQEMKDMSHETG
ncbi:hypothetical protein FBU30_002284, partial [Linnemannia zychae]